MLKLKVLCVLLFAITFAESARILAIFPTPSISHQVVFRPLTHELAKNGHEVVVITTDPAFPDGKTPGNLTEIDIHDVSYSRWNSLMMELKHDSRDSLKQLEFVMRSLPSLFSEQMKTKPIQKLLSYKKDHFDLLIVEAWVRLGMGFSYVFPVPVIQISSFGTVLYDHEAMGLSSHPILYPAVLRDRLYNLTMWEKVTQLKKEINLRIQFQNQERSDDEAMKKIFGANIPPLRVLNENIHMLFLNIHPIWENNRPVPPGVIFTGGLHQKPLKDLPKDLKSYLDSSKNGVIYFSLGTNVKPSHLPPGKLKVITDVFSRLPYDILWKWDNDELPGRSKNIRISKWLPQSDLLRHPNIKLFITQGGLQSTDEAITAGVPLIGIPMLADQWYNVENYVGHKIGLRVDIDTMTEEKLQNSIEAILNDKSYRENIVKLRNIMQDQPQTPLERAVWWTEYVLRHRGARHLRSPGANITWAQYLELELVLVLITSLLLSLAVIYVISKAIWKFIRLKVTVIVKNKMA